MYTVCHSTMNVDHDAQAVELVFLPDLVVPPELAALAVHLQGQVGDLHFR
jgi:hypothetical protein